MCVPRETKSYEARCCTIEPCTKNKVRLRKKFRLRKKVRVRNNPKILFYSSNFYLEINNQIIFLKHLVQNVLEISFQKRFVNWKGPLFPKIYKNIKRLVNPELCAKFPSILDLETKFDLENILDFEKILNLNKKFLENKFDLENILDFDKLLNFKKKST